MTKAYKFVITQPYTKIPSELRERMNRESGFLLTPADREKNITWSQDIRPTFETERDEYRFDTAIQLMALVLGDNAWVKVEGLDD